MKNYPVKIDITYSYYQTLLHWNSLTQIQIE